MKDLNIPLVCTLDAIPAAERDAHEALAKDLFRKDALTGEFDDGYQFTWSAERIGDVAHYISNERLCCPFWTFTVRVNPGEDTISLDLQGPDGVKELLKPLLAEMGVL
jgi:hypothetical protein